MKRYIDQNLKGVDFTNQELEGTLFWGCDLQGVDFSGSNLKGVSIIACDIRSANFEHCTNFDVVDLAGSVFESKKHRPEDKEFWDKKTAKILRRSRQKFNII